MKTITQERLKEALHYNPKIGVFTWNLNRPMNIRVGDVAGYIDAAGYRVICIDGDQYKAHRLSFLYMNGYSPEYEVDHKNGIRDDNRWDNLRHVTRACNLQNQKVYKNNSSGFTGVVLDKENSTWVVRITISGEVISIGSFGDRISAALARCEYEKCCPDWTCNCQAVNFVKLRKLGYNI
jgi:hypothetical protein